MQKFQVKGKVKANGKETTVELEAESQEAAEAHVARVCPNVEVVPAAKEAKGK